MNFYNTTTGKIVNLTINDPKTDNEYTQDLIGNNGNLNYNADDERYEMDQECFDWWSKTIEGLKAIDERVCDLKEIAPNEDHEGIDQELGDAGNGNDLESHIVDTNEVLDQLFAKYLYNEIYYK